jgi:hypothetical protein
MCVLTAYIDESGYGAKDIIVLGGFLGNDDEWAMCGQEWKIALGKRKALHMKELRWKKKNDRTKMLLERLGPVPHRCGLVPAWARLRVSDYADLVDDTTVSRKMQHGYLLGAQFLCLILLRYVEMLDERIKIVFEYNEHFAPVLPTILKLYGEMYPFVTSDGERCLAGIEFATKDSASLTQPADYLAYARLQQLRDPKSIRARLCAPILDPQPGIHVDVERGVIRKLISSPSQQSIRDLGRQIEPHLARLRKTRNWGNSE